MSAPSETSLLQAVDGRTVAHFGTAQKACAEAIKKAKQLAEPKKTEPKKEEEK